MHKASPGFTTENSKPSLFAAIWNILLTASALDNGTGTAYARNLVDYHVVNIAKVHYRYKLYLVKGTLPEGLHGGCAVKPTQSILLSFLASQST